LKSILSKLEKLDLFTLKKIDLIQLISEIPLAKSTIKRLICTNCDHYASDFIDSGYGCGYRNTQMLLSSIRDDPELKEIVFNNSNDYICLLHICLYKIKRWFSFER